MSESSSETPKKKESKSFLSYLAWWKTDPAEIEKQVSNYHSMKVHQSARGISLLFCVFSVVVTVLLGSFMQLSGATILGEVVIWSGLGFAMFRGQRWAFAVAMVLWTFEKGALLIGGASSGRAPIAQIIWWAIYMNAFMLGFRVETARKNKSAVVVAAAQ